MRPAQSLASVNLTPATLPDAEGQPAISRSTLHRTQQSSVDVWEFEVGEFEWRTDADHCTCVLTGSADVELADGRCFCLRPGTSFFLPRGMHGRWNVLETLRTVSVRSS